jgi:hypothetical protein
MRALRRALRRTPIFGVWRSLGMLPDYWYWRLRGRPWRTPHYLKQKTVLQYAREFHLQTLVEAGTYYGDMIAGSHRSFRDIYSVELDDWLYQRACRRFASLKHVKLFQGSSGDIVPKIVSQLERPALFWLDAGYYGFGISAERSKIEDLDRIQLELRAILSAPQEHVVLIDDAHGFSGRDGALSLEELKSFVFQIRPDRQLAGRQLPDRQFYVASNIIRIHAGRAITPVI